MASLSRLLAEQLGQGRERLSAVGEDGAVDVLLARLRSQGAAASISAAAAIDQPRLASADASRGDDVPPEGLPPGARLNADGSIALDAGSRASALDARSVATAARAAARAFDPVAADARRAATAPRHRAVIERYFSGGAQP
jgi:hypothetical protein